MRKAIVTNLNYDRDLRRIEYGRLNLVDHSNSPYFKIPSDHDFILSQEDYVDKITAKDNDVGRSEALLILAHGIPDNVLLRHQGDIDTLHAHTHLLSMSLNEEAMLSVAENRDIYIFACRVASGDGNLIRKLSEHGAKSVSAFQGKPSFFSSESVRLWREIDGMFCRCATEVGGTDAMIETKHNALAHIETVRNTRLSHEYYAEELSHIESVVDTMTIV